MSSDRQSLAILLDAPLQSWGVNSRFQQRGTENHPSKSALLGMLAAAMGIDKHAPGEREALAPLAALALTTYRVPRSDMPNQRLFRRLTDFHTVGGGYDRADPGQKRNISRKASGGMSTTVVTRREYLLEARFIAVFEGKKELLEKIAASLLNPVWGVWLGRKTCLPSRPLTPVICGTHRAAFETLILKMDGQAEADPETYDRMEEGTGEGAFMNPDQPKSYSEREFESRSMIHHRPKT